MLHAISTGRFAVALDPTTNGISAIRSDGVLWATHDSPLFRVDIDGQTYTVHSPGIRRAGVDQSRTATATTTVVHYHLADYFRISQTFVAHDDSYLLEATVAVTNLSHTPLHISRIDSLVLDLPVGSYEAHSYTAGWGSEFSPQYARLTDTHIWQSRAGRSSQGMHPWVGLVRDQRALLTAAVAWSGNWIIRADAHGDAFRLSAGLNDWAFGSDVAPQQTFTAPSVVVVCSPDTNGEANAAAYHRVGRSDWYPRNALSDALPVEWNHWWTYEDKSLSEDIFRANVDAAAHLGIEIAVLDAGWFGPADPQTNWYDIRGDWHIVNTTRFPSGIRALSDYTHAKGLAFGIWCEIEALGHKAQTALEQPAIVARRDDTPCGYVCLASPAGWQFAYDTLARIITEYNVDWIKLDFNLDPGAGCNRTDHGHGAGDGLYGHYMGYYRLLSAIRAAYPHVVLENCSSGGLRIDLGIAKETHMAFLSDPDWPEHSLQNFWGAASYLAPTAILHWHFGEWGYADHPQQTFDPTSTDVTPTQLDYYARIAMLHRIGFSLALPSLLPWIRQRYETHIAIYKDVVRRFIGSATLTRLTNQPRRDGTLERYAAFAYHDDAVGDLLIAVFRMPGAKPKRRIWIPGIDPTKRYRCIWLGDNRVIELTGSQLSHGLLVDDLAEPGSALIHIIPSDNPYHWIGQR